MWFGNAVNGEAAPRYWQSPDGQPAEFDVDDADPEEAFELWQQQCSGSRAIVDAAASLDSIFRYQEYALSLRWILGHMIEEYAPSQRPRGRSAAGI